MPRFDLKTTLAGAVFAGLLSLAAATSPAAAAGSTVPPEEEWPHGGVNSFSFKTFDRAALQRGFQVYKQVCSACHAMHLLSYRNLEALGYSEEEIKAIAAEYEVTDGPNDQGEMFTRPALPSDRFRSPFPNAKAAAAANNGKAPPDLSLIVKAREHHEDYVFHMLTGFVDPPEGVTVPDGAHYNQYYPGHLIAMPPMLFDDGVTYDDGTPATAVQQARDVTQFLAWAAEPHMEARRSMGVKVILFLMVFAGLLYMTKRRIWETAH